MLSKGGSSSYSPKSSVFYISWYIVKKLYYTDASTMNNGKPNQVSRILITDGAGSVLEDKVIGEYTINEAELIAIARCVKLFKPEEIKTDSRIAKTWIEKGWDKKKQRNLENGKLTSRHKRLITRAHKLLKGTKTQITWTTRDLNLAGLYLEHNPKSKPEYLDIEEGLDEQMNLSMFQD